MKIIPLRSRIMSKTALVIPIITAMLLLPACEEDDKDYDHDPPEGQGSLIIDNRTDEDIDVYIDGLFSRDVGDDSDEPIDLDPGLYRVVLNEDGGDRSYRNDIDILGGRLTVLVVKTDSNNQNDYSVSMKFD